MLITVLSAVKTQATSKAGKPYSYIELAYKGEDGKVQGKKVMPFGESKQVADMLDQAQPSEVWNITMVKNEGTGYWDWTNAKKSDGTATTTTEASVALTTRQPAGKVIGSTYETPEERAKKQVFIVKQSSISNAITLLLANGGQTTVEEVLLTAGKFERYVFSLEEVAIPKKVDSLSITEMEDDIPY